MSAPMFTPGPWWLREGKTPSGEFGYIEGADHNRVVADLPDYKLPGGPDDCDEANGRLIAAAPELYDACSALLAQFEQRGITTDQAHPDRVAVERARAALAKAVQS